MSSNRRKSNVLAADELAACEVVNPQGRSPIVLACEHAGKVLPRSLGSLGLTEAHLEAHIAWDIGAAEVARRMAERLDAPLYLQTYSRLVCDCNRHPSVGDFVPVRSEDIDIPGNVGLSTAQVEARRSEVHAPFHDTIAAAIDRRLAQDRETIVVSIHSFTPVFLGYNRPWHVGVLYNRDPAVAQKALTALRGQKGLCVGDNEPYSMSDETDYTIPVHSEQRKLPGVEFEIRNDQIRNAGGQDDWAARLSQLLLDTLR